MDKVATVKVVETVRVLMAVVPQPIKQLTVIVIDLAEKGLLNVAMVPVTVAVVEAAPNVKVYCRLEVLAIAPVRL